MEEAKFDVVLKGYGSGQGEYYIEQNFAEMFKLPKEKVKKLFKAVPRVLKDNLTQAEAEKFKKAIDKTGASAEVVDKRFEFGDLAIE